ncbi:MAG: 23S rRNA (cytidine2498-2'-O)-methyltransferase, partial [Halothiobacillaceae bacterium]
MQGLFLYCRAGFESECAAEIHYHSALLTISGYAKTKPASGYVLFIAHQGEEIDRLVREL